MISVHHYITALRRPNMDVLCSRQGALAAIAAIANSFGAELPERLPQLWEQATAALLERMPGQPLTSPPAADPQVGVMWERVVPLFWPAQLLVFAQSSCHACIGPVGVSPPQADRCRSVRRRLSQAVINALQVFSALGPALHPDLVLRASRLMPAVGGAACHSRLPVRTAAVQAAASLTAVTPAVMLPQLLRCLVWGWPVPVKGCYLGAANPPASAGKPQSSHVLAGFMRDSMLLWVWQVHGSNASFGRFRCGASERRGPGQSAGDATCRWAPACRLGAPPLSAPLKRDSAIIDVVAGEERHVLHARRATCAVPAAGGGAPPGAHERSAAARALHRRPSLCCNRRPGPAGTGASPSHSQHLAVQVDLRMESTVQLFIGSDDRFMSQKSLNRGG